MLFVQPRVTANNLQVIAVEDEHVPLGNDHFETEFDALRSKVSAPLVAKKDAHMLCL